jgi:hypothetical protein
MEMEIKQLKLVWPADTGPAVFVNNATIQLDESLMSYLTFFQAVPPAIMGTAEEKKAQLEKLETIEAKPVVKLAMTKDTLKRLADIINSQLQHTYDSSTFKE